MWLVRVVVKLLEEGGVVASCGGERCMVATFHSARGATTQSIKVFGLISCLLHCLCFFMCDRWYDAEVFV